MLKDQQIKVNMKLIVNDDLGFLDAIVSPRNNEMWFGGLFSAIPTLVFFLNDLCARYLSCVTDYIMLKNLTLIFHRVGAAFPSAEYVALNDLYKSCGGLDWIWSPALGKPWVFNSTSVNPCSDKWQGIECNAAFTGITQINLNSMNLLGSIPDSIGNFQLLKYLFLKENFIDGSIPNSIAKLSALLQLDLSENGLSGTIPASLSQLGNLHILFLYNNHLSGTIPSSFGGLLNLRRLHIGDNKLAGSIPESIGGLNHLNLLYLLSNGLTGTIPSSLGMLMSLQQLAVQRNQLSGTIPESLMSLSALTNLYLDLNPPINGTIPERIGDLTNLQYLYFAGTSISGTLPSAVGHLNNLLILDMQECLLSGTLPSTLGNLSVLQQLELGQNYFTGTVPPSVGNLTQLTLLSLSLNQLTGTMPDLSDMHSLQLLWLFDNFLTGTIPSAAGALPQSLVSFELFENLLTGSFPEQIGDLSELFEFSTFYNYFSGTLPASMGKLSSSLQYIEVYNNHLTGTIPSSYSLLAMLTTMLVQNNHLSGEISGLFNVTAQSHLFTIEIGGNVLRGNLPGELFSLPQLNSFSAVGNCFGGSLPDNICAAASLSVLLLDGASSGCSNRVLPMQAHAMQGTIPPCLLQLPNIQVLHLSSNGFTGSLPVDVALGPALYDLALDHNRLTGYIPTTVQSRPWKNLDLSFNKLTGTLKNSFVNQETNSTVSVNNNRLSGIIPVALLDLLQVDILAGNLFACKPTSAGNDLPQHDEQRKHYQCGSNAFNIPYFLWMALVFFFCVAVVVIAQYKTTCTNIADVITSQLSTWWVVWQNSSTREYYFIPRVKRVFQIHSVVTKAALSSAGYILCVLLPVFLSLGAYHATHTHEYAYTVSAAFLTGITAGIVEFVFFSVLALLLYVGIHYSFESYSAAEFIVPATNAPSTSNQAKHKIQSRTRFAERVIVWSLFISMNLVVVLGANIGFLVASTNSSIHSNVLTALQIMLAVFKLTWKWFCGHLIRWVSLYCAAPPGVTSTGTNNADAVRTAEFASLQVFITLVNNIAIPCVVAAVASPNCFYNYFYKTAKIEVAIEFPYCIEFTDAVCSEYTTASTEVNYQPPFIYSYQCSSSLLTYYAPSFLISCLLVTFVFPVTQIILVYLYNKADNGTYWYKLLRAGVPRILRPMDATLAESLLPNSSRPHFDAYQFMIAQLSQLGILLTFGVVFPPLGFALVFTIIFVQYYTQLVVARFVCSANRKNLFQYVTVLEAECAPAESLVPMMQSSSLMLLSFNCCFCALFVFDTLGDKVGFNGAVWVLIVLPLLPLLLYGVFKCVRILVLSYEHEDVDLCVGIELPNVVKSPMSLDLV